MHRIIPEFIIENCRAGRHRGAFKAGCLFLDISGFSVITDALMAHGPDGAEALALTMREVFDPLVNAILEQGGMITGYAGDSITALYAQDGSDASMACRPLASAYAIQNGLSAHPFFETPYGTFRISAKIGLSVGPVTWGILRSHQGERAVYYFRGNAVEEAALAEHQAYPGDIILTDEIHRQLDGDIETEPLANFHALRRVTGRLPTARPITLPPVDLETAAVFAPRQLLQQDLRGEFRQTVPLFMRVPDLSEDQLEQFINTLFDLQAHYGGLMDRIDFGDKGCNLVVLWGAPVAHENDIDRALSFLLDVRARVDFPVTAGITYYTTYTGYIGGRMYETYTAYGWGMNLAARFMMSAKENETWVDERIFQRAKPRFHLEYAGEQSFKGFAQKQKAYTLGGREVVTELLFRGAMVGRAREMGVLEGFAQPLWEGKYAGVLGVWGEAGIGKSRLIYEFAHSPIFQGRNCLWALCRTDEMVQLSFSPFRDWLGRYFEISPAHNAASRLEKFAARMDELIAATGKALLAADLKRARSFLAVLLDLEWPDPFYEQLDPQARYDNTILGLISLLKAESLRQPLILFMEDAQFLDEDSRNFLGRLKRSLLADPVPYPIAILIAARLQSTQTLLEDGLVDQEIMLAGLADETIALMCADLLGQSVDPAVIHLVNERAEGNPFFIEQLLRYLQQQNLLEVGSSGEWILKKTGEATVLPVDVEAMLVARLDKLEGPVKEVIQAASVLGLAFDTKVVRRMISPGATLQNEIEAAEQAGVWSPLSESRYIFNHGLLRDVAYNMQSRSSRRDLHARAFDALKELFGSNVSRHYAELAYHSEQAERIAEARSWLELAGDAARDEYQNAQALDFYQRALGLLPETDINEGFRLHREREKILSEYGSLDERTREIEILQLMANKTGEPGDLAEVLLLRAQLAGSSGLYDESAELAHQSRELALKAGRFEDALQAYLTLLDAFYTRGIYKEAIEIGEEGMALARQKNALQEQAAILNALGLNVLAMKNPSVARAYFEQGLSIFRTENDMRGLSNGLANLGLVAGYQGNYHTALDYYEQSLRLMRGIGSRKGEARVLGNLGWICGLLGDTMKAQTYVLQALQIAREIGDIEIETYSLINLSAHAGTMANFSSATDYARKGLALARQSNDRNAQAWALTYLGHGLFDSGMLELSMEAYQEAVKLRCEMDQPVLATEPAAGLARIFLMDGDPTAAQSQVNIILSQLERDGTLEGTDQPLRVYLSSYLVLSRMDDPQAHSLLNTAHDMLKTRANGISDPSARQAFLENIPYNREILSLWQQHHQVE